MHQSRPKLYQIIQAVQMELISGKRQKQAQFGGSGTHLVQGPDCSVSQGCFGGAAEQLKNWRDTNAETHFNIYTRPEQRFVNTVRTQRLHRKLSDIRCWRGDGVRGRALTRHSGGQLSGGAVWHVDDGRGRFVNHHLVFVPQAALDEVKQGAVVSVKRNGWRKICFQLWEIVFLAAVQTDGQRQARTRPRSPPEACWRCGSACSRQRVTWGRTWWTCSASWTQPVGHSSAGDTADPGRGTVGQITQFIPLHIQAHR